MRMLIASILLVAAGAALTQEAPNGSQIKSATSAAIEPSQAVPSSVTKPTEKIKEATAQSPSVAQQAASASAATNSQSQASTFKVPAGYSPKKRQGQTYYCKKTVVLGSRFPKEICMTEPELVEFERRNQAMRDSMAEKNRICGSSAGCAMQ